MSFCYRFLALTLLVLILGACAATPAVVPTAVPIYTTVTQAELTAGEEIPVPTGDVILSVTGKIANFNVGESVEMDLATLESLGIVEYTVLDPFEEREITYRGILVSALFDVLGVDADAVTAHTVALNDYSIDIPMADLRRTPVFIALQADGEYMQVADKGPAIIVFPYDDFEFDQALFNNYWIWQLRSVDIQ